MILPTPESQNLAVAPTTKAEIRPLSELETKAVAGGGAIISSADLGSAQPDGGSHGMRADRIYRK